MRVDNLKAIADGKFQEGYKTALADVKGMIELNRTPMGLFNETMLKSILMRLERDLDDGHSKDDRPKEVADQKAQGDVKKAPVAPKKTAKR